MNRLEQIYQETSTEAVEIEIDEIEALDASLEMAQTVQDIDAGLEELNHYHDIASSFEEIAAGLESQQTITQTELLLVQNSIRLGFSGTGLGLESVCPDALSVETWSCEGFKNVIVAVWKAIMNALKRIYEMMNSFFKRFFGQLITLKGSLGKLKRRAESLSSANKTNKTTELGGEINRLLIGDEFLPKSDRIRQEVRNFSGQMRYVVDTHLSKVETGGDAIVKALKDFDPAKPEASLNKVSEGAAKIEFSSIVTLIGKGDVHSSENRFGSEVACGKKLLNGRALFVYNSVKQDKDKTSLGYAERVRGRHFTMKEWRPTKVEPKQTGTIETLPLKDILDIIAACQDMISFAEKHENKVGSLDRLHKKIESAGNSLVSKLAKEQDSSTLEAYYKSAASFATATGRWVANPQITMCEQALINIRGLITICNKCLSNYKM